jgi:two-component system sensor histidine kinase UhpB
MYQRIASELHGSTCQHLIAASLSVMRLRNVAVDPCKLDPICEEIDAALNRALGELRTLAYLLYPQGLMADGLKATIEQYAEELADRTSLKVATTIPAEVDRLPYEQQHSLLRVIQEALTNVFRHAKATKVEIAIAATAGNIRLRIGDDGQGMPAGQTRRGSRAILFGVGIPAMKTRLQQMGGTLDIQSTPAGTTVCAAFPRDLVRREVGR